MKKDVTAYPTNSLYDLKRFDLNILWKDEPNFDSFRKALDSRLKEMTAFGIGTKKQPAEPLFSDDEEKLWSTGTVGLMSSKSLHYGLFSYNCKVFGFRAMNEHVNLMAEQYELGQIRKASFFILRDECVKMCRVVYNNCNEKWTSNLLNNMHSQGILDV